MGARAIGLPLSLAVALSLAAAAFAQPAVPRVVYDNPLAGLSIEIPEDWEMATNDWGVLNIGLESGAGTSLVVLQPQLWFFFTKDAPAQAAVAVTNGLRALGGSPVARPTGNGDEWEVVCTLDSMGAPLLERWICRRQGRVNYILVALVRPERAAQFQADIDAALASAHLIAGPAVELFQEPTENAYRLLMPRGWRWEGRIIRTSMAPGVFEWKVQAPDGSAGAFNAPPAVFNVQYPYTPAAQCAGTYVLQGLQQQVPGLQLENVREFPRVGANFVEGIRMMGLGDNPQVHKARADYLGNAGGVPIRLRVDISTVMFDASPLLGGRGNWMLFVAGTWAPADRLAELYPICRGIVASIATDPDWKQRQSEEVWLDRYWRAWMRRLNDYKFIEDYLGRSYNDMPQLHDSDITPPNLPPPDDGQPPNN